MKILQTIGGFYAKNGGSSICTYDLIHAIHSLEPIPHVDLLTPTTIKSGEKILGDDSEIWIKNERNDCITPLAISRNLYRYINKSNYDIYHTNGIWLYINHITCSIARRKGKPYVITPHGMLYPQALSQNYWKKWPLLKLWFNKDIHNASCIHVTCEKEMNYMRDFGYKGAIALISNTFNKPDYTEKLFREHIKRETSCNKRNQLVKIGFIGRLDPIKNAENILYGVSLLKEQNLEVYIIGTGNVIYEKFLKKEAKRLNLTNRVHFVGFLDGYKKYEMLSQMDAIFVPSKSENFGMIVPESLLVGTPVMASLETPWNSLNTEQCGWWTDNSPETISKIINEIRSMTSEDKIDLSKRCRDYIVNNFNSKVIASQMMQLYNWLNNTVEKPEFVYD